MTITYISDDHIYVWPIYKCLLLRKTFSTFGIILPEFRQHLRTADYFQFFTLDATFLPVFPSE